MARDLLEHVTSMLALQTASRVHMACKGKVQFRVTTAN